MSEELSANNSTIAKNTLFLYMRMLLILTVSLYTVRVVLQTLSVVDYGVYGAVGGIVASFAFVSSTLASASQRFFAYELGRGREGKIEETFSTIFLIYLVGAIVVVFLAEVIGLWFLYNKMVIPDGREEAAFYVFQFALSTFLISLITNPFQAMIIAKERMVIYAYISIFDVILKLIIVYLLTQTGFDKLKVYAFLQFCTSLISNSFYIIYCKINFKETIIKFKIQKNLIKSVLGYSICTLFGTIASICNSQGLNLILNIFFGPVANAAYSIASQISGQASLFANNFYVALRPSMIKSYSAGELDNVNKICMFSSKCIYVLMGMLLLPIFINIEQILIIWLGEVSPYMVVFVRLALLYSLIIALSNPITTVVQANGNIKLYHLLVDGVGLFALPITYLLYKSGCEAYWGYLSMLLLFSFCHFLRLYVLKRVFPIFNVSKYLRSVLLPLLFVSLISYSVCNYMDTYLSSDIIDTIFSCIITFIIFIILSFGILINSDEKLMIKTLIKTKFLKIKN